MANAGRIPAMPESGAFPIERGSSSHLVSMRVGVQDVFDHLASETMVGSSMGAQLDRMREGTSASPDYARAQEGAEVRLLSRAAVIRCVDALDATPNIFRVGEACSNLRAFAVRARLREGAAVVAVQRAYQPWALQWQERGLVAVYDLARGHRAAPGLEETNEDSLAHAFRIGKARRARNFAALLLGDAEVAIHAWVERWSRKGTSTRGTGNAAAG